MVDLPTRLAPSSKTAYFSEYSSFHSNNLWYAFLLKTISTSACISIVYQKNVHFFNINMFYYVHLFNIIYGVIALKFKKITFYMTICKTLKSGSCSKIDLLPVCRHSSFSKIKSISCVCPVPRCFVGTYPTYLHPSPALFSITER